MEDYNPVRFRKRSSEILDLANFGERQIKQNLPFLKKRELQDLYNMILQHLSNTVLVYAYKSNKLPVQIQLRKCLKDVNFGQSSRLGDILCTFFKQISLMYTRLKT